MEHRSTPATSNATSTVAASASPAASPPAGPSGSPDTTIRCLDDPLLGCTARAAAGVRLRGAPLGPIAGPTTEPRAARRCRLDERNQRAA
ncbi:MAG: hypothetical protein AB8G96_06330 [Phycisphaerales bacterium]